MASSSTNSYEPLLLALQVSSFPSQCLKPSAVVYSGGTPYCQNRHRALPQHRTLLTTHKIKPEYHGRVLASLKNYALTRFRRRNPRHTSCFSATTNDLRAIARSWLVARNGRTFWGLAHKYLLVTEHTVKEDGSKVPAPFLYWKQDQKTIRARVAEVLKVVRAEYAAEASLASLGLGLNDSDDNDEDEDEEQAQPTGQHTVLALRPAGGPQNGLQTTTTNSSSSISGSLPFMPK
jgi:hypothetical protein